MPNTYEGIGLNSYLQPIGSPIDSRRKFTTAYGFDSQNDRGAIKTIYIQDAAIQSAKIEDAAITTAKIEDLAVTDAKIDALNASKITAGTIDASNITVTNLNATNITTGTLNLARLNVPYLSALSASMGTVTAGLINGGTINANNASVINIDANKITTGTINATTIEITNLDADNITTGSLDADRIDADYLSAISANLGTVNTGLLNGGTVNSGIVRTASSGSRVEMSGSDNELRVYNSTTKIIQVDDGGLWVRKDRVIGLGGDIASSQRSQIYHDTQALGGLYITSDDDIRVDPSNDFIVYGDLSVTGWCDFSGDVDMNDHHIKDLQSIEWNTKDSNSSADWALYMYNNSGYSLRTRMNGSTWTVDQTSA